MRKKVPRATYGDVVETVALTNQENQGVGLRSGPLLLLIDRRGRGARDDGGLLNSRRRRRRGVLGGGEFKSSRRRRHGRAMDGGSPVIQR